MHMIDNGSQRTEPHTEEDAARHLKIEHAYNRLLRSVEKISDPKVQRTVSMNAMRLYFYWLELIERLNIDGDDPAFSDCDCVSCEESRMRQGLGGPVQRVQSVCCACSFSPRGASRALVADIECSDGSSANLAIHS